MKAFLYVLLSQTAFQTEPFNQRRAGHAENVGQNRRELKAALLQIFLNAVLVSDQFFDQNIPVARPVPHFPNLPGRNIARRQQSRPQKRRNPVRVLNIRLFSGNILHVMGIGHDDIDSAFFVEDRFQNIVNGKPVDPRAFHRNIAAAVFHNPPLELVQTAQKRRELPNHRLRLLFNAPFQKTRHQNFFVYIQATAYL